MRFLVKIVVAFIPLLFVSYAAMAQCAMCRATVENNVSNGDTSIGAGLNFGILYLFVMPYLVIGVVGFLWYRKSKVDAKKQQHRRHNSWQVPQMPKR